MPDLGTFSPLIEDSFTIYLEGSSIVVQDNVTGTKSYFSNSDISPAIEYAAGQILSQGVNTNPICAGSIGIKKGDYIGTTRADVNETTTNDRHGIWIHGEGPGTTITFQGTSGTPLDSGIGIAMAGCRVYNMRFVLNQYVTRAILEYGDHINTGRRTDHCKYHNLTIEGPNGNFGMYSNVAPVSGQTGILIYAPVAAENVACFFTDVIDCEFISLAKGVWCSGGYVTSVTVDTCKFIACEEGIVQDDGSGQNTFNNIFVQGNTNVGTTGIRISGSGKNTIIDNVTSELHRETGGNPSACQTILLDTGVTETYIGDNINNVYDGLISTSKTIVDNSGDNTLNYYISNIIAPGTTSKKQHYMRFESDLVKVNSAVKINLFNGQLQYYGNNSTWDKYYSLAANYAYNLSSNVVVSFPDMRTSGNGDMVVHNAPSVMSLKTVNPVNNTMPYYAPTAFSIHMDSGNVKMRNNGTGVTTGYSDLNAAMLVVLANTNDPSVEIGSGVYNLPIGFTGWTPVRHLRVYCKGSVYINVPSGYTGKVWNYDFTNFVCWYNHIEGGVYDEQSPQSNLWNLFDFDLKGSSPYSAVYSCTFKHIKVWRCNKPINVHTTGMSWFNQNMFEDIYSEACSWLGAYMYHDGATPYGDGQNGCHANTFINVSGQSTTTDTTNHYPQVQGGFYVENGEYNNFITCNPWDLYKNAAAPSMTIGANANFTHIFGGLVAQPEQNFTDNGRQTTVIAPFSELKSWKGLFTGRIQPAGFAYDPALEVSRMPHTDGFENIARFGRFGSADYLAIENGSNASGSYGTVFRQMTLSDNFPNWLESFILQNYIRNDLDVVTDAPLGVLSARLQTAGTDNYKIVNRPLWSIRNHNTDVILFRKDGIDLIDNYLKRANLAGIKWRVVSKSSDVTLALDELAVPVSASAANRTITLPTAATAGAGKIYLIQKSDTTSNLVIIDAAGSETIDGLLTWELRQPNSWVLIISDGSSNWNVIGRYNFEMMANRRTGTSAPDTYYIAGQATAAALGTAAAVTANQLYSLPFKVDRVQTIDKVGVNLTTQIASSNVRIGIYKDLNGVPGALVADLGTVGTTNPTGLKEITGLSQKLQPGVYWLTAVFSHAPTISYLAAAGITAMLGVTSAAAINTAVVASFTYAALPNPHTTPTKSTATSQPALFYHFSG